MIPHSLIRQVLAMRAAAATLLEQSDAVLARLEEIEGKKSTACEHPDDHRTNKPIIGYPDNFFCSACNTEVSN